MVRFPFLTVPLLVVALAVPAGAAEGEPSPSPSPSVDAPSPTPTPEATETPQTPGPSTSPEPAATPSPRPSPPAPARPASPSTPPVLASVPAPVPSPPGPTDEDLAALALLDEVILLLPDLAAADFAAAGVTPMERLHAAMEAVRSRLVAVERRLASWLSEERAVAARLAAAQGRLEQARAAVAAAEQAVREQAGDFYMSPAWGESVVFAARSIEDAGRAQGYMAALLDERVDVVGQMRAARHRLERERDRAEDAAASLSRTGARIRADRALLESLTKKMRALAEGVAVSFGRGSADFARAIAAAQAGQPAAATMDRFMFEPLRGRLSSPYGPRVHPIYGYRSLHTGLDIAAAPGTPVVAARDGAVVTAGPAGPFGLAVVVDHGERIATVSAHLSAAAVAAGDRVRAGDVIGLVGCTGWCTGPHLHFEVWFDGITRDPAEWIVSVPAVAGARTLVGGSPASHPIRTRRAPADQSLAGLRNPFEDLSAR